LFVEVHVRIENRVPNGHEARVVTNVLCVMVNMVGTISSERNQSENAPWELVAAVTVMGFKNSNETPLDNGEEMKFWTKDKHSDHGGVMVSKCKLKRVSVFTCNTYWVHEFVMLFMDPLVKWHIWMFAV
jgi:hypothetical protein